MNYLKKFILREKIKKKFSILFKNGKKNLKKKISFSLNLGIVILII